MARGTEGLVEIDIDAGARAFVEDTREVGGKVSGARLLRLGSKGEFEAVADTLWVQEFIPMRVGSLQRALQLIETHPRLRAIANEKGNVGLADLVDAFIWGWGRGTDINEELGLSDIISDWLLDTFGPWPPW